jgi:hypothetical protein
MLLIETWCDELYMFRLHVLDGIVGHSHIKIQCQFVMYERFVRNE